MMDVRGLTDEELAALVADVATETARRNDSANILGNDKTSASRLMSRIDTTLQLAMDAGYEIRYSVDQSKLLFTRKELGVVDSPFDSTGAVLSTLVDREHVIDSAGKVISGARQTNAMVDSTITILAMTPARDLNAMVNDTTKTTVTRTVTPASTTGDEEIVTYTISTDLSQDDMLADGFLVRSGS